MLRANSRLRRFVGQSSAVFLDHASGAIRRLLPHVQIAPWAEHPWAPSDAQWTSSARTEIRITLAIGPKHNRTSRSLTTLVSRRNIPGVRRNARLTLETREHALCKTLAQYVDETLGHGFSKTSPEWLQAVQATFDESVVARQVQAHHSLQSPVGSILSALHTLSEQSYENKSLTFGCILDPAISGPLAGSSFPTDVLQAKKYKVLSDGYRTAYHISGNARILNLVDLDRFERTPLTERNYYPDWAERIARASRDGRCGIALSRQGDILVFDEGTLRFTYRYGRWHYWNHSHIVKLLRDRAAAQRVPRDLLGRVVGSIYRAALDVSFRRSGGLFLILHNRNELHEVVRVGDAVSDQGRPQIDLQLDPVVRDHTIQALPRSVVVELASLDGAVVLANSGQILAYGAILQPKKTGRTRAVEGSRTKAAIGASNYGLAVKISADGEIAVYYEGEPFIQM